MAGGKQTTNLASINKTILSALPVPVAPAVEQEEIVRRIESLITIANAAENSVSVAVARAERQRK